MAKKKQAAGGAALVDAIIDKQYRKRNPGEVVGVASRSMVRISQNTVDIFSKIVGRKLYLKNRSAAPGSSPSDGLNALTGGNPHARNTAAKGSNNGVVLEVSFDDPALYCRVQDQLSRIVFQTDPVARDYFVESFGSAVARTLMPINEHSSTRLKTQHGHLKTRLALLLQTMLRGLEYHRVLSLWGELYAGSAMDIRDMTKASIAKLLEPKNAPAFAAPGAATPPASITSTDVCECLVWLFAGLSPGDDGDTTLARRIAPAVAEAVRRVEGGSYKATLIVTRWLMVRIVDEYMKMLANEPPEPLPDEASTVDQRADAAARQAEEERQAAMRGGSSPAPEPPAAGADADADADAGDKGGTPEPQPPSQAPQSPRSVVERMEATKRMLGETTAGAPNWMQEALSLLDASTAGAQEGAAAARARQSQKLAEDASATNIKMAGVMQAEIDDSKQIMQAILERAEAAMRQQVVEPEANTLLRGIRGKVTTHEVQAAAPPFMSESDRHAALRLRALFERVLCRRRTVLVEDGDQIDVGAVIERKTQRLTDLPVFAQSVRGRGFEMILLLDLSGSMAGDRIAQVQRAVGMLLTALDFPFAKFQVLGFNQRATSAVLDLHRFPRRAVPLAPHVGGYTPLLPALMLAVNELNMRPGEERHLMVLTDGEPTTTFEARGDGLHGPKRLSEEMKVAAEINRARQRGINTTALALGDPTKAEKLQWSRMFGKEGQYWEAVTAHNLTTSMLRLVRSAFAKYIASL
jgi:uncharacterized protein YegL